MNLQQLQRFLGTCTIINFGVYTLGAIFLLLLKDFTQSIYAHFFQIDPPTYEWLSFVILGIWKALIFIFNLVPYIALRIMNK